MSNIQSENWENMTRVEKLGEILVKFQALRLSQERKAEEWGYPYARPLLKRMADISR